MVRKVKRAIPLVAAIVLLGWLLSPGSGVSQEQRVVFSQVVVSGDEASLLLELDNGEELSAEISGGEIRLNGETLGRYGSSDEIESSWRDLLSQAISMDPEDLPAVLRSWTLPPELGDEARAGAEILRARLTGATPANPDQVAGSVPDLTTENRSALQSLVQQSDRLRELAVAIDEVEAENLTVYLGESVRIPEGENVDGPILAVDGSLDVEGTVDGDIILIGSRLDLGTTGRITGSVRTTNGEITGDPDGIVGGITEISAADETVSRDSREVEEVVRDAVREATADVQRNSGRGRLGSSRSPFRSLGRGITGLFQTLITFGIVFAVGLGVLYFFPRQLEVVSKAARDATGRSLLVGLAGMVLALPLWVVGIVLLAISIIGIPLLLAWVPLVPVAIAGAIAFGYLAVARNLGDWFSAREVRGMDGLDAKRPAVQIGAGLVILLAAFALSNVFEMAGPLFGVFEGLLLFTAVTATAIAASIGLGAVILTRAGREPDFEGRAWRRSRSRGTGGDDAPSDS